MPYIYDIIGIGKESDGTAGPSQNGGLILSDVSSLANADYFLAGHNNATGISSADLTSSTALKRWARIWYVDKTSASSSGNIRIAFDLSDAGFSGTPANASNYRLLKRAGTSGSFSDISVVATAIVNSDQVEFTVAANNIGDGYYTVGTSNESSSPLPVELVSFSASAKEDAVELKWNTATEVDNYGFDVERVLMNTEESTMNAWMRVGFVEGCGTSSSAHAYAYTDRKIGWGRYSYRLKQIDRDGRFEYSKAVQVDIVVPHLLTLSGNYPNPFNPTTAIDFTLPGEVHHAVFDAAGLASGIYFSRLEFGGVRLMKKLLLVK